MKKLTLTIAVLAIAGLSSAALNIQNANFDDDSAWTFESSDVNSGWSPGPTTAQWDNGVANVTLESTQGAGYAVIHQEISLAGSGISGGDTVTMSALVTSLGSFHDTALLKIESWAGGANIGQYEHVFTASTSGAVESYDFTLAAGAESIKVVVGATGGWGGPTAGDSEYTFDNVQVVPEPATMGLIGLFGGGMMALRRFRIC